MKNYSRHEMNALFGIIVIVAFVMWLVRPIPDVVPHPVLTDHRDMSAQYENGRPVEPVATAKAMPDSKYKVDPSTSRYVLK